MERSIRLNSFDKLAKEVPYSATALSASLSKELQTLPPLPYKRCIFRVPHRLRESNRDAYTPRVISIGPLHHGQPSLKPMESYKRRFLRDFLRRTEASVKDCVEVVKSREAKLRSCYAETIELGSDDFVKMILLDATFVVELLFRYNFGEFWDDHIQGSPRMMFDVRLDLCMVENQLPFFILEDLFNLYNVNHNKELSFREMALNFGAWAWEPYVKEGQCLQENMCQVEHIVDLIRLCLEPSSLSSKTQIKIFKIPSALELYQAGVGLKSGPNRNLFDIRFENAILKIPRLNVMDRTRLILRNLVAFEQCFGCENYITHYVALMSSLVKSAKDVELLIECGIIENCLKDSEDVSTLFKDLLREVQINRKDFQFGGLIEDLNAYCNAPWHKWNATLKHDYFNTPWATISVIAAVVLLLLTFIQTVCAFIQIHH